jgi:phosphate:Na+ symporter
MDRWKLFAWLGLVLFGLEMFEEAIKKLWWPKLRMILQKYTDKWRKAVLTGMTITGILNSSTLISLLTLWFVATWSMALLNAVGVVVWANIWSTATGLIVAALGTWEFNIGIFAMPLIALAGGILLITDNKYRSYRAKWLVGFWLFFLGISFFKENMDVMQEIFNLAQYKDMSLWIFGLIGVAVTAIVHSSGAVGVMTLAALSSGVIWFEASFAIILWANVWTTFSSLAASLSWNSAKRQIGMANFLFNLITVGIGILLFKPYIWLTLEFFGYKSNLVMGNAMINFIFNITTSLLFVPILKQFTRCITKIIPTKVEHYDLDILEQPISSEGKKYDSDNAAIALEALDHDKKHLTRQSLEYISLIWGVETRRIENNEPHAWVIDNLITFNNESHRKMYTWLHNQFDIIFAYIQQLSMIDLDVDDRKTLNKQLEGFIWLSSACKDIENIRENINMLREAIDPHVRIIYYELLDIILRTNRAIYSHIWRNPIQDHEDISTVLEDMRTYRNNILSHVAPYVVNGNVGDMDVSSLVNMNGEITDCIKDIAKAV